MNQEKTLLKLNSKSILVEQRLLQLVLRVEGIKQKAQEKRELARGNRKKFVVHI